MEKIYCLDIRDMRNSDKDEYVEMFEASGWQLVCCFFHCGLCVQSRMEAADIFQHCVCCSYFMLR
ncbi:DUF2812 domain-containing protein [Paenibacillus sp. S3N08]|uniref:DUF2812 domain-containing protein n=1 Tax=Paenibacillus agricola TaxID=2716264 RepID=A0ABX0JBF6_9BACL|nr:DUF2812 domain-containing protein [Paenibacillus agricola]